MSIPGFSIVDLTHPIHERMTTWPGDQPTRIDRAEVEHDHGDTITIERKHVLSMAVRTGTHVNLPPRQRESDTSTADLQRDKLVSPLVVLDYHDVVCKNADFSFNLEHLNRWEERYGKVQPGTVVCLFTGWANYWSDAGRYYGTKGNGSSGFHFPGISPECLEFLVSERRIIGFGTDTPATEPGSLFEQDMEESLARLNIFRIENLRNLDRVPTIGGYIITGVLPLRGEERAPARVLCMVPVATVEE